MTSGVIESISFDREQSFTGYTFQNGILHHHGYSSANPAQLLDTYDDNCGVFAASTKVGETRYIFTDPLAQYPVFYSLKGSNLVVDEDLHRVKNMIEGVELNTECLADYLAYFHPLNQETLISGVSRLKPGQIIIEDGSGARIVQKSIPAVTSSYETLLKETARRLRLRASAVLRQHTPVVHLSGGMDSRLSLAAMVSAGFRGSVFSFGDGLSEDRMISRGLSSILQIEESGIRWFHSRPTTVPELQIALRAFNGMKVVSLSNYGEGHDYAYSEVTGFFSEALLKGFGNLFKNGRFSMFDYARTVSSFSDELFDQATDRASAEANELLEQAEGNSLLANCLFYLQNRSAGHFGAHSVVNNRRFVSVDLLYDPFMLNLVRTAPYEEPDVRAGAIIVDLIRELCGVKLATFPYDRRIVPRYAEWTRSVESPSCFESYSVPRDPELPPLPVETKGGSSARPGPLISQASAHFDSYLRAYPLLRPVRSGTRGSEVEAHTALLALIGDLLPECGVLQPSSAVDSSSNLDSGSRHR